MKITVAKKAGFCFGVKRAVDMAEKALAENKKVYCLGSLIHNPQMINRLEKRGLVTVKDPEKIPDGSSVVIRSHGAPAEVLRGMKRRKMEIIDATCPFVKKAQDAAESFHQKGYSVVICGDPDHAEVIGINSKTGYSAFVVSEAEKVEELKIGGKIGVLSQTTQKINLLKETVQVLLDRGKHIEIENTICLDSSAKQSEVRQLAKEVDVMIVVGGKSSSNTTKLAEISKSAGIPTYHIETKDELEAAWFEGKKYAGIAAGASTAQFLIDETAEKIKTLDQ